MCMPKKHAKHVRSAAVDGVKVIFWKVTRTSKSPTTIGYERDGGSGSGARRIRSEAVWGKGGDEKFIDAE